MGCSIAQVRRFASEEQAEVIDMVIEDTEGYSNLFAAQALTEFLSTEVDELAVRYHRGGECPCA